MRNALVKKLLLAMLTYFFISNGLYCQKYRQMIVPVIGQKTDSWCWAASIQMVMKFHQPSNALNNSINRQCFLVKRYLRFNGVDEDDILPGNCCFSCADCSSTTPSPTPCINNYSSVSMLFSSSGVIVPDYFDLIFNYYGFNSTQQINTISSNPILANTISWELVKKQIDDCRPFIVGIDPAPTPTREGEPENAFTGFKDGLDNTGNINREVTPSISAPTSDHFIVAKGYYEDVVTSKKYIVTNDPWVPCCGHESIFPYSIFTSIGGNYKEPPGSYLIERVLMVVHSIYPDTVYEKISNCASCDALKVAYNGEGYYTEVIPTNLPDLENNAAIFSRQNKDTLPINQLLLPIVVNNARQVIGFNQNLITKRSYAEQVGQGDYHDAKVRYLDFKKFVNKTPKSLADALVPNHEVFEVVWAGIQPNIISILQTVERDSLLLRKITTYTALKEKIPLQINGIFRKYRNITLSNKDSSENVLPYELVKYSPFAFEFYTFQLPSSKEVYMSPALNYPGLEMNAGTAYSEKKVLKELKKATYKYLRAYKDYPSPTIVKYPETYKKDAEKY